MFTRSKKKYGPFYGNSFSDNSDLSDEEFPYKIVSDNDWKKSNKNKGGKSIKNMGVLVAEGSYPLSQTPKKSVTLPDSVHFAYAVVVGKRVTESRSTQEFINDYSHQLLPYGEAKQRLAIVIGENEQETIDVPEDDLPDTQEKQIDRENKKRKEQNNREQGYNRLNSNTKSHCTSYLCR